MEALGNTPRKARYGYLPDLGDLRDFKFVPNSLYGAIVPQPPSAIDLRPQAPPIYDQGQLGSCTANATAESIRFIEKWDYSTDIFNPSRLFIYYNSRFLEGTTQVDAGSSLRDAMRAVSKFGVCPEKEWMYSDDSYRFAIKPNKNCYENAKTDLLIQYLRIQQDTNQMKACLAAGFPFIAGFTVYESFEDDQVAASGIVPMPGPTEAVVGGHAVMVVGYNDALPYNTDAHKPLMYADGRFICQNSWGSSWGQAGFFTIPYAYFGNSDLASDFWTVRKMER